MPGTRLVLCSDIFALRKLAVSFNNNHRVNAFIQTTVFGNLHKGMR